MQAVISISSFQSRESPVQTGFERILPHLK
jgi:hypothetical protein